MSNYPSPETFPRISTQTSNSVKVPGTGMSGLDRSIRHLTLFLCMLSSIELTEPGLSGLDRSIQDLLGSESLSSPGFYPYPTRAVIHLLPQTPSFNLSLHKQLPLAISKCGQGFLASLIDSPSIQGRNLRTFL